MDRQTHAVAVARALRGTGARGSGLGARKTAVAALIAVGCLISVPAQDLPAPPSTFSILGFDPATGEVGGAVQSRVFSVGNGVLWAEADAGIVATQAIVDVSYGPKGLELLRRGMNPETIVRTILDGDPDPGYRGNPWPKAGRQFAVMDAKGNYAAHTGPSATPWAGHKSGKFSTAQGNILAGEASGRGDDRRVRKDVRPPVTAADGRARRRSSRRRRHPRHAVGRDADRSKGMWRLVEQRHRPAPAGGRRPGSAQGDASPRRSTGTRASARAETMHEPESCSAFT